MTNTTLTGGASTVMSSSGTNVLTLYGIQTETISKSSGLIDFPMPMNDSNSKIMMDLMGTSRTISIDGIVTVDDVTHLYDYVNDLVGLKDSPTVGKSVLLWGQQGSNGGQAGWTYAPESINRGRGSPVTIQVYVTDVSITSDAGNPNSIKYQITLMECDGTSSV